MLGAEEVELLEDDADPLPDLVDLDAALGDLLASKKIRPLWIGSRRLIVRRRVLLPLPLGPMTTRVSPVATSKSMPSRTRLSPKLLWICSPRTTGAPLVARRPPLPQA